jgi:hypothetical protein
MIADRSCTLFNETARLTASQVDVILNESVTRIVNTGGSIGRVLLDEKFATVESKPADQDGPALTIVRGGTKVGTEIPTLVRILNSDKADNQPS